jgi:hypothetical protein
VSFPAHGLPAVPHEAESALQVPPSQVPPQHSPPSLQACPSATHCLSEQRPPMQDVVQQSRLLLHVEPAAPHAPARNPHALVVASQVPEQQSVSAAHAAVGGRHVPASALAPASGFRKGSTPTVSVPHPANAKTAATRDPSTKRRRERAMPRWYTTRLVGCSHTGSHPKSAEYSSAGTTVTSMSSACSPPPRSTPRSGMTSS